MIDELVARATAVLRDARLARLASAGVALAIAIVFVLAALVEPSPEGHGTHLQLGLGQCTMLQLTGWPCPMCGATTSFALMAHLRPIAAAWNQPFSTFLFVLSAAAFAIASAEVVDPRGRWGAVFRAIEVRETLYATLFLIAMGLGWAWKAYWMASAGA